MMKEAWLVRRYVEADEEPSEQEIVFQEPGRYTYEEIVKIVYAIVETED